VQYTTDSPVASQTCEVLGERPGVSTAYLAGRVGISPQAMKRLLYRLEEEGLVIPRQREREWTKNVGWGKLPPPATPGDPTSIRWYPVGSDE